MYLCVVWCGVYVPRLMCGDQKTTLMDLSCHLWDSGTELRLSCLCTSTSTRKCLCPWRHLLDPEDLILDWSSQPRPKSVATVASVDYWMHHFTSWGIFYVNLVFKQIIKKKRTEKWLCLGGKFFSQPYLFLWALPYHSLLLATKSLCLFSWKRHPLEVPVEITQVFCINIII